MKIATTHATSTGTLAPTREVTEFTVDADASGHLMQMLTSQYANEHEAVLREYAANARDSHLRAGTDAPVRITLPSDLDPTLTVADTGVGLSADEVRQVLTRYGLSLKGQDNNPEIGGLGIGFKAGFTIAPSLTVVAVKDGRKVTAQMFMQDSGRPACDVLSDEATDAPNGVSVIVPVPQPQRMRKAAEHLFTYWPEGSVLIDGREPERPSMVPFGSHGTQIIRLHRRTGRQPNSVVVMGGMSYPLPHDLLRRAYGQTAPADDPQVTALHWLVQDYDLAVSVPMDAVDFTPSRDSLRDSDRTVQGITAALDAAQASVVDGLQEWIDAADTIMEAARRYGRADRLGALAVRDLLTPTWHGQPIPGTVTVHLPCACYHHSMYVRDKEVTTDDSARVGLSEYAADRALVVTEVPADKIDKANCGHGTFLKGTNGHVDGRRRSVVMFTTGTEGAHEWFTYGPGQDTPTMTWDEFTAEKAQWRGSSGSSRTGSVMYRVSVPGETSLQDMSVDDTRAILTKNPATEVFIDDLFNGYANAAVRQSFIHANPDALVITPCGTQTVSAAQKRFPTAQMLSAQTERMEREAWEALTDLERASIIACITKGAITTRHLTRVLNAKIIPASHPLLTATATALAAIGRAHRLVTRDKVIDPRMYSNITKTMSDAELDRLVFEHFDPLTVEVLWNSDAPTVRYPLLWREVQRLGPLDEAFTEYITAMDARAGGDAADHAA